MLSIIMCCVGAQALAEQIPYSPSTGAGTGSDAERYHYAREWQALADANDHRGAVALATTWVADAQIQFGEGAPETFIPLCRLADSYMADEKTRLALKHYRAAITVGERRLGPFSSALIEPLVNLSGALTEAEQHDESVSLLMRAKDITHRNLGIYNDVQNDIVDRLTENYVYLGDMRQATREQRLLMGSAERKVGEDSPAIVPALQQWAEWQVALDRFKDARKVFYRAIDVLEKAYGPDDVRIVEMLNLITQTFYSNEESHFPSEGARALRRAVAIYQSQETIDHADLFHAQISLGDWYIISGQRSRGLNTYAEAITAAREAGVSDDVVEARYSRPRPLKSRERPMVGARPLGMRTYNGARMEDIKGTIVFELDVDERGRPRNIQVVEDTIGRAGIVNILRARLQSIVYRPKFENGAPAVTRGLRRQFDF